MSMEEIGYGMNEFLSEILSNPEGENVKSGSGNSGSETIGKGMDDGENSVNKIGGLAEEVVRDFLNEAEQVNTWIQDNRELMILTVSLGCLIPLLIYYWNNHRIVAINCWACGKENLVKAQFSNKFTCGFCDQFNGFTDDGNVDYSAEAESRGLDPDFFEGERGSVYCERRPETKNQAPKLCPDCQAKADYKVKSLRDFEPTREERYEIELEIHERRLEMYCQPCHMCQEKLNRHLEYISSQLPKFVAPKPRTKINTTIINSIISRRRNQIQQATYNWNKISKLTISRLKLLIYSSLVISLVCSIFNFGIKNYVQFAATSSIFIYFCLVYTSLPNTSITFLSVCIIRDMIPKIETNFPIPDGLVSVSDGLSSLYSLNMNISMIHLNAQTLILYALFNLMKKEFVAQAKLEVTKSSKSTSSPPLKAFIQTKRSSPKKPFLQPGKMKLSGMMDGVSLSGNTVNPMSQAGFTPPQSYVGMKSQANSMFSSSRFQSPPRHQNTPEPMEDDISPYDSVSNWGDEHMDQSFGSSKGSHSPTKMLDQSMRSDAMSILSDAVATTVTTASILLKTFVVGAIFMNLVFFYFLARKVIENAPAKGRMTLG